MRGPDTLLMKGIDLVAAAVLAAGGLCWGLVGVFGFNPIEALFGSMSPFARLVYALFGIAAVYEILFYRVIQRRWQCSAWPFGTQRSPA
jgi:uncharacterized protein